MRIGILGTRGIPNQYGGFEQFAEFLSVDLVNKGHEVWVYNSHQHSHQENTFKGVNIIHCYDPEKKVGTVGQFIYDFNCIIDSRKRRFDILLQLGYTSSSIWRSLLSNNQVIITNMDGLEWKRSKYSKAVQYFLKRAESWAVRSSDYLVADSIGIQSYLKKKYKKRSYYIPYGADVFSNPDKSQLEKVAVKKNKYDLLIARLEPENSIEMIIEGKLESSSKRDLLIIGNDKTKYGQFLHERFGHSEKIRFLGAIYDQELLNNLRYFSNLYFHGHQVGGTNPSLLEAMGSHALIAAHKNDFNKAILRENGFYFSNAADVKDLCNFALKKDNLSRVELNEKRIRAEFSWHRINSMYEDLFKNVLHRI